MKSVYVMLIAIVIVFSFSNKLAAIESISMEHYNVSVPLNWNFQKEKVNSVVFSPSDDDGYIYISISSKATDSKLNLDESWEKVYPYFVNNNNVIKQYEEDINNIKWKAVLVSSVVGQITCNTLILFTVNNNIRYTVQYNAPEDRYKANLPCFNTFMNELKLNC
jgi:hypothetical protein